MEQPRQFWGKDMNEALRAVRATLGSDALILDTKSVPKNRGGKKAGVEITATREEAENEGEEAENEGEEVENDEQGGQRTLDVGLLGGAEELREIRQELAELKSMLCWLIPGMGQKKVLEELMTQGISPSILARLAQETQGTEGTDEREKIGQALARLIPTGGDVETKEEQRKCLALIGPTGVGKTTTVVKLTVRLARQGGHRVGWVNLDNRRIAGTEQLAAYAGVLGIPYEVVENPEDLVQALERLSACDLILIDTAGVSPRDDQGIKELAELTQAIPDLKCSLLLSTATNGRDMTEWVKLYDKIGFDSVIFTKLDECRHFGPLINIALTCGRPLSYITIGQRVVNDLEVARPEVLARLLLP
jgi:flagellar biosynthesis protein FlhF